MAGSRLAIGQAFRVEKIGEETIVFNRSSGETIHRVSGNAAEALRLIADGVDETDVPAQFRPAVDELVAAGVVEGSRVCGVGVKRLRLAERASLPPVPSGPPPRFPRSRSQILQLPQRRAQELPPAPPR